VGVELAADRGQLRCSAPAGALTPEVRGEILRRKAAILAALAGAPAPAPAGTPGSDGASTGSIPRQPRSDALPVSFAQRRLWFLDRLAPGHPFYNVVVAFALSGRLDAAALEQSVRAVTRRHEALRTRFVERNGEPLQAVDPDAAVDLRRVDLTSLPDAGRLAETHRLVREEGRRPFDLGQGPLLRAHLVRLADTEHVLLFVLHHIICDNWSVRMVLGDLLSVYGRETGGGRQAAGAGRPDQAGGCAATAAPAIQYADYAVWQRRWSEGDEAMRRLEWWRHRLSGAPGLVTLPWDRPRPAVQTYAGSQHLFRIPSEPVEALRALGRGEAGTLFMTLLAAFAVLLRRCGAEDDLVIGTPVAGRPRAELEEVAGCFANTLPLRLDLAGDPTFRALLGRARESCLDAYAHDDVPFELMVEGLAPARSLGHSPIVQVMFQLLNAPAAPLAVPGLRITPIPVDNGTAKFDLTLFLREDANGLAGTAEYATDLFDSDSVARLMRAYERVVCAAAASPDRPIGDLEILEPEETRRLVIAANGPCVDRPDDAVLHHLVEGQGTRTPDAPAVVCEGSTLTYADLLARAGRVSHALRRLGIGPGTLVGVCLERSVDLVVTLLGVLESGAAYLPLDPDHPAERLDDLLADAAPRVIVTHAATASRLPTALRTGPGAAGGAAGGPRARRLDLDADREAIARQPGRAPDVVVSPDDLAYVLYTSGSTGRPKGVMIPHRGVCNRLLWMQDALALAADDRVLQKTPFGFDVSVWEFFWPLMTGAGLVVARPGGHRDPAYLARLISECRITVAHFVPPMLDLFLQEPGLESSAATLRQVVCSGEALSPATQAAFFARLPGTELHNLYGPTEVSIDASAWRCQRDDGRSFVPLGRPIANVQVRVLDARLRPVPPGVPGEIYLGGIGLARGYLGRPDLTAASFVPDPFGAAAGARLYRTGDQACWRTDGMLQFLGRRDRQIKLRGVRVELGEVEAALRRLPNVREAAAIAHTFAPGDVRLVAYLVSVEGRTIDPVALRDALRQSLPDHLVPSMLVPLAALPLTPNGKLDRRALEAPAIERRGLTSTAAATRAPRTPIETALVSIWSEVLRLDQVGVEDDFFALGGHSLLAVQIVSRVRARLGIELPVRAIFQAPRLADLAAVAERRRTAGAARGVPALVPLPRSADLGPPR
jgi:amino acid adenylation domain-containing protein